MNVSDAKLVHTQYGLETYLDRLNMVTINDIQLPTPDSPFFNIKIGIEYYRLRERNYYNSETRYFWLRFHPELGIVHLMETDKMSLFGVKDKEERIATKELIGEWLINTSSFKQAIRELIQQKKTENVVTAEDIRRTSRTIDLLEKLLELKTEDILNAPLTKYN